MSPAERLYRMLLYMYPAEHRRAYGQPMLQHARDLNRFARRKGRRQAALMNFRLLKDGIFNAAIEHLDVIGLAVDRFKPLPWLTVLLAVFPGLLLALARLPSVSLDPLIIILVYLYLGILVLAPPITWWRRRRFPVWTLLPAGTVVWFLTGGEAPLVRELNLLTMPYFGRIDVDTGVTILNTLLALGLFVTVLRGRRLSASFWLVTGVILIGYLLITVIYTIDRYGSGWLLNPYGRPWLFKRVLLYFSASNLEPSLSLLIVAIGLLAARQHGVLAILVVVGAYSYLCLDTDYMSIYALLGWPLLTLYMEAMIFLYLVVVPVALLLAKNNLVRAAAVFVPIVVFHLARLTVPQLVTHGTFTLPWRDGLWVANVLLSLLLAWVLYSQIGNMSYVAETEEGLPAAPLTVV